jgi:chromosome segregation ATPase
MQPKMRRPIRLAAAFTLAGLAACSAPVQEELAATRAGLEQLKARTNIVQSDHSAVRQRLAEAASRVARRRVSDAELANTLKAEEAKLAALRAALAEAAAAAAAAEARRAGLAGR